MRRALWWTVFGAGGAAVVAGLGWISAEVIRLEREEALARAEVARQETLHLALWRMDSWLAPLLARESARTWFEYQSYYPEMLALNRLCEPIAPGEVVVPSPLLDFRSELFPLHVQFRNGAGFTSPQVPSPEIVAQGIVGCVPFVPDNEIDHRLRAFILGNDGNALLARVESGESQLAASLHEQGQSGVIERQARDVVLANPSQRPERQQELIAQVDAGPGDGKQAPVWDSRNRKLEEESAADFKARLSAKSQAQTAYQAGNAPVQQRAEKFAAFNTASEGGVPGASPPVAEVGPLIPIWLGSPPDRLMLARRVRLGSDSILQGVLVDWPALRRELLDRIVDLYPTAGALLQPVASGIDAGRGTLASLPVRFTPPPEIGSPVVVGHRLALGLGVVWLVALGAIGTIGLAMHSTLRAAQRTSRFASSVTHELRTPLTTFRLYAEMLADGMVTDEEKARQYLRTLRDESTRLGLLVENVLAWSRLEEGRSAAEPRAISANDLIVDSEPVLRRRCDEAGAALLTRSDATVRAIADPTRVRQILFNLVDNACKYAGEGATVEVSAVAQNGSVIVAVDDDGPGIAPNLRAGVFRAFDRGSLGPGDAVRGLGLGLSISLELARSLGGALHCSQSARGGARFELELKRSRGDELEKTG